MEAIIQSGMTLTAQAHAAQSVGSSVINDPAMYVLTSKFKMFY